MKILNKITKVVLIVYLFVAILPIKISAQERKGIVKSTTGIGIIIRSGAGTTYEKIGGFDDGQIVTIISEVKPSDNTNSKCSSWYEIVYSSPNAYVCADLVNEIVISANPKYDYETELAKFPDSYKPYIKALHEIYPNAVFIAVNAIDNKSNIMDFNTAVTNESVSLGKSLLWDSNNSRNGLKNMNSYIFETKSFNNNYPGGGETWYAASYDTVAYYMDPRNFLNEKRVFMFESQSLNTSYHTISGIESILTGSYMSNAYVDNSDKTYAEAIYDAAVYSGVSPYFLASRILQEVGTTRSGLVLGTYASYPEFNGYYNYYNINAGGTDVVYNGLSKAKEEGWDSEYKAIVYGSSWIGNNFINAGQDTGYFQKWDIKCGGRISCYTHQFMQNIEAPYSEASSTYKAYKKAMNDMMYLNPYLFNIPVYSNMPTSTKLPSSSDPINYLDNIKINDEDLANFSGLVNEYSLELPYGTTKIELKVTKTSPKAKVTGDGSVNVVNGKDIPITVTAENGNVRTYTIHVKISEDPTTIKLNDVIDKIVGINFTDTTISGVTSVDVLKEKVLSNGSNVSITVKNKNEEVITTGNLATGYQITLSLNNESKSYEMLVYGDNNGDGEITIVDLLRIQKQLLKSISLNGVELTACDVNKDGTVSILDLLLIQKHLLGSKYINQ